MSQTATHPIARSRRPRRQGALYSVELAIGLPIVIGLVFAVAEFSFLWAANHQIKAASLVACRQAAAPVRDRKQLPKIVRRVTDQSISNPRIRRAYELRVVDAPQSGMPVVVEIKVPMDQVSPNLLRSVGFDIRGRMLTARTVMMRE